MSVAARVSQEMNVKLGNEVCFEEGEGKEQICIIYITNHFSQL